MPDPFALMAEHLKPLDGSLRELVGSDHPVLTRVAQHFFELAGKRFRPTLVLLASAAANGGGVADARQVRLSEITEMIHAASLIHDDVIDLADTRRGTRAVHRIYGNKVAVLADDFLLARASVLLQVSYAADRRRWVLQTSHTSYAQLAPAVDAEGVAAAAERAGFAVFVLYNAVPYSHRGCADRAARPSPPL